MTAIRVLLVDDDPLLRSGLALMLSPEAGIEVVGEAGDGDEVLAAIDRCRPDVVLMDVRMPRVDGVTATRLLRQQPAAPQVVVLTTFDADELVVRCLEAGANGFLLKSAGAAEIVRAVEQVHDGDGALSPSVTRRLVAMVAGDGRAGSRRESARIGLAGLSPRERDVAMGIGRGLTNAQIGEELFVSVGTVKSHTTALLAKLELDNRVQIALLVQEAAALPG